MPSPDEFDPTTSPREPAADARALAAARAVERSERLRAARRRDDRIRAVGAPAVLVTIGVGAAAWWAIAHEPARSAAAAAPQRVVVSAARTTAAAGPSAVGTQAAVATASVAATPSSVAVPPLPPAGMPQAAIDAQVSYPGAPPVTPTVIFSTKPAQKLVAITLDDGIPIDTRLLDLFEKRHVHVTTFLLGQAVLQYPKLVARMHRDGIEIGVHGWDHKSFTTMSRSEMRSQLNRTQAAITKITGVQAPYFRPPYGAKNSTVVHIAAQEGYKVVMWDDTFVDTAPAAWPAYCYGKAMKFLHPGAIILCHWGRPATYGAMVMLLDELDREGYRVVTISELLAQSPPVKPYRK